MEPDLESFPLLRPDQIPLLHSHWLQKSIEEIDVLIVQLQEDEGPTSSLLHYAVQQRTNVMSELSRRAAGARLAELLGATLPEAVVPTEAAQTSAPTPYAYEVTTTAPTAVIDTAAIHANVNGTRSSTASPAAAQTVSMETEGMYRAPYTAPPTHAKPSNGHVSQGHATRSAIWQRRAASQSNLHAAGDVSSSQIRPVQSTLEKPTATTSNASNTLTTTKFGKVPPAWLRPQPEEDMVHEIASTPAKLDKALGLVIRDSIASSGRRSTSQQLKDTITYKSDTDASKPSSAAQVKEVKAGPASTAKVVAAPEFVVEPPDAHDPAKPKRKRRMWEKSSSQLTQERQKADEQAKKAAEVKAKVAACSIRAISSKSLPVSDSATPHATRSGGSSPLPREPRSTQGSRVQHEHAHKRNAEMSGSEGVPAQRSQTAPSRPTGTLLPESPPTVPDGVLVHPGFRVSSSFSDIVDAPHPEETGEHSAGPTEKEFERVDDKLRGGSPLELHPHAAPTGTVELLPQVEIAVASTDVMSKCSDAVTTGCGSAEAVDEIEHASADALGDREQEPSSPNMSSCIETVKPQGHHVHCPILPPAGSVTGTDERSNDGVCAEARGSPIFSVAVVAASSQLRSIHMDNVSDVELKHAITQGDPNQSAICEDPLQTELVLPSAGEAAQRASKTVVQHNVHATHEKSTEDYSSACVSSTRRFETLDTSNHAAWRQGPLPVDQVSETSMLQSDGFTHARPPQREISVLPLAGAGAVPERPSRLDEVLASLSSRPISLTPELTPQDDIPAPERPCNAEPGTTAPLKQSAAGCRPVQAVSHPASAFGISKTFPDFKALFTGCLPASSLPAFASGGFSGARARQQATSESAVAVDVAAKHVLSQMEAFLRRESMSGLLLSESSSDTDAANAGNAAFVDAEDTSMPDAQLARACFINIASSHREVQMVVREALKLEPAWHETPGWAGRNPVWNIMWSWGKPPINRNLLLSCQRVNHFKHAKELTRKDLLKKNLARYQCLGQRMSAAFTLQSPTFVLPKEYLQFAEVFGRGMSIAEGSAADKSIASLAGDVLQKLVNEMRAPTTSEPVLPDPNLWIMKPVGLSRGRGISLVSDITQVKYAENMLIQKYIHNPLLLDGYKFDLRLYVLVTSFCPLEAFIYRRGFARLSSRPFTADPSQIDDLFIHLTNSSIQKHSETAKSTMSSLSGASAEEAGGTKCSLEYLWRRLKEKGIDTDALWENIIDLVVKSLVCVDDVIPNQPNSFEVYGYDVLIDDKLKPWLVEVNSSPSLGVDSDMDLQTKKHMIHDTLKLVQPIIFDRVALCEILKRRMAADGIKGDWVKDLDRIFGQQQFRGVGEMPSYLGQYQRICPGTEQFNRVMKLKLLNFKNSRKK